MCRLLVKASVVPSSPILVTMMKVALRSSETSFLTRATRRNIPEDNILHSHRRENSNLTWRRVVWQIFTLLTWTVDSMFFRNVCTISKLHGITLRNSVCSISVTPPEWRRMKEVGLVLYGLWYRLLVGSYEPDVISCATKPKHSWWKARRKTLLLLVGEIVRFLI
jgi:hypothetical protein